MKWILLYVLMLVMTGCGMENERKADSLENQESISAVEGSAIYENTEEQESSIHEDAYEGIYDEILQQAYDVIVTPSDEMPETEGLGGIYEASRMSTTTEALMQTGYCIQDINGDRIPELMLGSISGKEYGVEQGSIVNALFTYVDGEVVCLFEGYYRSVYEWMGDGRFFYHGSGGAMYSILGIYKLAEDGTELICEDYYFSKEKDDTYQEILYYHNTTGEWNTDSSEELSGGEEEFWGIYDMYSESIRTLWYTPFYELTQVKMPDEDSFYTETGSTETLCAACYLGYFEGDWEQVKQYFTEQGHMDCYPALSQISEEQVVLAEGSEWYLLIPGKENMTCTVYESDVDESNYTIKQGKEIKKVKNCESLLLRTNVSEIYPECIVVLEDETGRYLEYAPCLSMADGTLKTVERVWDFTRYELLPSFMFNIITDPSIPQYRLCIDDYDIVSTPVVGIHDVEPVMFEAVKDNMDVVVELIEQDPDTGEEIVVDTFDSRRVMMGDVFFISTELSENKSPLRVTATMETEEGIRKAVWYAVYSQEEGRYYVEHVSGGLG